jgi:hypothetical protein
MNIGDRVKIERDETRYPSKGSWGRLRGKTGTVVEINLGEYGVIFGKVTRRTDGRGSFNYQGPVTWFRSYELRPCGRALQHGSLAATAASRVAVPEMALARV